MTNYSLITYIKSRANLLTQGTQAGNTTTALVGGGFVMAWSSDIFDGSGYGVYMTVSNAFGVIMTMESRVNDTTLENQLDPTVIALEDGGFVIFWMSYDPHNLSYDLYCKKYDANGVSVGGETKVNTNVSGDQSELKSVALPGGGGVYGSLEKQ